MTRKYHIKLTERELGILTDLSAVAAGSKSKNIGNRTAKFTKHDMAIIRDKLRDVQKYANKKSRSDRRRFAREQKREAKEALRRAKEQENKSVLRGMAKKLNGFTHGDWVINGNGTFYNGKDYTGYYDVQGDTISLTPSLHKAEDINFKGIHD